MHPRRLESRILKGMNQAVGDYGLIGPGDHILVAMSGGKDSYGLLWGLRKMQAAAPFHFELVPYHLDQGQPGHDVAPLRAHFEALGLRYEIEVQDTYTRVVEQTAPGKIYCVLCSRFRRAILYKAAARNGCNKVALGHHRDDLIETLLLNLLYAGSIKSMPPKLLSQDGPEQLIRPLVYVPEVELAELAEQQGFVILPCRLCGSQDAQRKYVKRLLTQLEVDNRHLRGNLLNALQNVVPSHLLDARYNPLYPRPDGAAEAPLDMPIPVDDGEDEVCATPAPPSGGGLLRILDDRGAPNLDA